MKKPIGLETHQLKEAFASTPVERCVLQKMFGWGLDGYNKVPGRSPGADLQYDTMQGYVSAPYPSICVWSAIDGHRSPIGYMAQVFTDILEVQTAAMLRGSYSHSEGGLFHHGVTGHKHSIDYLIPDGNKGKLDSVLTNWADPKCHIPEQLHIINKGMIHNTGYGLTHIVLTPVAWSFVKNNKAIARLGGEQGAGYARKVTPEPAGYFSAVFHAMPWVTFHILGYQGRAFTDGAKTADVELIEDTHAAFFPEVSKRWAEYREGTTLVFDDAVNRSVPRDGFHPYAKPMGGSGWSLQVYLKGAPALLRPDAVCYGRILGE